MAQRGITMGDVLYVLKHGFVYEDAVPAKQTRSFKYQMEGKTPNSGNRSVRIVVIPQPTPAVVVVTIMWVDEK